LLHYARRILPRAQWVAVELDPEVARVARQHFGVEDLIGSGYVDVRIGNGLSVRATREAGEDKDVDEECDGANGNAARGAQPVSYSESADDDAASDGLAFAARSLAFVVVDVDSKDNTVGMSCPPPEFVQEGYLRTLAGLLIQPTDDDAPGGSTTADGHRSCGVLVVNVSARDKSLFNDACRSIGAVFPHVFASSPGDDSVNVVVVASLNELPFIVNASSTPSDQRPSSSLDGIEGSDVFQTDLPEQELQSLFGDLCVWNPLSAARANNKKNSKKKKSGRKKR
jgi:hypothetical protein